MTRTDVARLALAKHRVRPETGVRMLTIAKQLMRYAATMGWVDADPLDLLDKRQVFASYRPPVDDRLLTHDEMRAVWNDTERSGRVLVLQLLTGLRMSEALAVQPEWVDKDGVLRISAEMKSRREHRVPLSAPALNLIRESFPVAIQWSAVTNRCALRYDFTSHACRKTCASGVAGIAGEEVAHRVLAHARGKLEIRGGIGRIEAVSRDGELPRYGHSPRSRALRLWSIAPRS